MCLAQIAKHSVELAEVVVEAEIFPKILTCLKVRSCTRTHARALTHGPFPMPFPICATSRLVATTQTFRYIGVYMYTYLDKRTWACAGFRTHVCPYVHARHVCPCMPNGLLPQDVDSQVRKNSATCIREIAKHTPQLARLIVNAGASARPPEEYSQSTLHDYPPRGPKNVASICP